MGRFTNELSRSTKQTFGQVLTGLERIGGAFSARSVPEQKTAIPREAPKANALDLLFVATVLVGIPFLASLFFGPCGAVLGAAADSLIVGDAALRVARKDRQPVTSSPNLKGGLPTNKISVS